MRFHSTPHSTPNKAKPLQEWTVDEVVAAVANLGEAYASYEAAFRANGVDGKFLVSLTPEELTDLFSDLGITSKAHQKKVTQALDDLRPDDTNGAVRIDVRPATTTTDSSEATSPQPQLALTASAPPSQRQAHPRVPVALQDEVRIRRSHRG